MTSDEVTTLAATFIDPAEIYEHGISIDGKQFTCLVAHSQTIIGRTSEQTVSIAKCRTCMVVGIHQHKVNSNTAHSVVVRLANYLCEQRL